MSYEEDDDAFLYGDDEVDSNKRQKLDISNDGTKGVTSGKDDTKSGDNEKEESNDDVEEDGDDDDEDDDEDEDDSDSDSDIEFIIGSEEQKPVVSTDSAVKDSTISSAVVPEAIGEVNDVELEKPETTETTGATITRVPDIDINKVGEYEGKPITSINVQDLKEKPWRQPGADASEYFNYGFDEFTWTAYCAKQDKLRTNFNPQKVMMSMMPLGLPPMMMGMPGAPSLPGGIPPPGFPPNIPLPGQFQPPLPVLIPPQQNFNPTANSNDQEALNSPNPLPQVQIPPNSFNQNSKTNEESFTNLPRAPREKDPRDRNDYEREKGFNNHNNDFRERDRRPRYRGRR